MKKCGRWDLDNNKRRWRNKIKNRNEDTRICWNEDTIICKKNDMLEVKKKPFSNRQLTDQITNSW